ncbi:Os07g0639100 [Oryza sativa Japonica Group]|uniref:4-coumarate--CoA ligase n=1 Tax=Oryza sativa subsp. japonica TaxID=39947 RepID=A0A0P0XA36_ORYSJ|nr:Os07g0639100 [Oryza sativa Japonica Group]
MFPSHLFAHFKYPSFLSERIDYSTPMETELHLAAGYCAATGVYRSGHPPQFAAAAALSFPEYILPHMLLPGRRARPAFVDASTGAALSFAGLRALSLRVARALAAAGLRRGRVALLLSPNSLHFPALSLAVLSLGAVLSAANPLLTPDELARQADDAKPFLALVTGELAPKLRSIAPDVKLVLVEQLLADVAAEVDDDETLDLPAANIGRDDAALLFYSSGTTGRSKGVVSTHGNAIAMAASLERAWGGGGGGGEKPQQYDDHDEAYGCVLPMFHMFGFSSFVMGTAALGATAVVVPGRFSVEKTMAAVEEYGVTRLLVVPPMVVKMVAAAAGDGEPSRRRLRLRQVVSSGAPLQREHMARFRSCFPAVNLGQVPTTTEVKERSTGGGGGGGGVSIGRLMPDVEAKIVDPDSGELLPPRRTGELWVRGPSTMRGYLNNEEATALALVAAAGSVSVSGGGERWLRTGDLCYVDSRGLVYVVDRVKELIKCNAYQVAPAELEDVLATHPDIHDAAVAPYPDKEAGEIPMAYVVKKQGSGHLQEDEVISFVQNKVAPYKKIRKVVFVDSIPRSPSGKILRRQLKNLLQGSILHRSRM